MKKFASGLIIGIGLTLSMTVFASNITVIENPFPILVNGVRQAVEGYNINGSTYVKLTDVAQVTDGLVNVNFDGDSQVININTVSGKQELLEVEPVKETKSIEVLDRIERYMKDDIMTITYEGEEYGLWNSLGFHMNTIKGFTKSSFRKDDGDDNWYLIKDLTSSDIEKLDNIPYIEANNSFYIPLDYYYNTILPFLEK